MADRADPPNPPLHTVHIIYSIVILLFAITAFTATRSSTHGSFFIRILVATFYRHANHKDVEELFKIVSFANIIFLSFVVF